MRCDAIELIQSTDGKKLDFVVSLYAYKCKEYDEKLTLWLRDAFGSK